MKDRNQETDMNLYVPASSVHQFSLAPVERNFSILFSYKDESEHIEIKEDGRAFVNGLETTDPAVIGAAMLRGAELYRRNHA